MPGKWSELTDAEREQRKAVMAEGRAKGMATRAANKRLAAEKAATKAAEAPPEAITVKTIETPGVIMDASGQTWTIPADSLNDDPRLYKSPFRIPSPEKDFYYQFEREDQLNRMILEGFKPVTLKEQGLNPLFASTEYGAVNDGLFRVDDLVCMKTPKVLEQRRRAAAQKMVDETLAETRRGLKPDTKDVKTAVEIRRGDQLAGEIKAKRSAHQSQGA